MRDEIRSEILYATHTYLWDFWTDELHTHPEQLDDGDSESFDSPLYHITLECDPLILEPLP